jgi:DNA polymerase IV
LRAVGPRPYDRLAVIAHVDMDAFYVSVELLRRPELRGRPVIVANGRSAHSRGVVMTASYEAREFGVHSALPLAIAYRRCPQAVLVPTDMALYKRASAVVMEVLGGFSDSVEQAGLDEAYLDLSGSLVPQSRARELKGAIRERTGLSCSVGLAPNKLLAKIASDLDKPDGLRILRPEQMLSAVGERSARLIPGVGPRTAERLKTIGIATVAELASADPAELAAGLGPNLGRELRDRANGVDNRTLDTRRVRKSESRETTFDVDVTDRALLVDTIERLTTSLCRGLAADERPGRTVTLKIRTVPWKTHTRSRTLPHPTADPAEIVTIATELLDRFGPPAPVRLIGVGVSGFESPRKGESSPARAPNEEDAAEPLTLELR